MCKDEYEGENVHTVYLYLRVYIFFNIHRHKYKYSNVDTYTFKILGLLTYLHAFMFPRSQTYMVFDCLHTDIHVLTKDHVEFLSSRSFYRTLDVW